MSPLASWIRRVLLRSRTLIGIGLIAASVVGVATYVRLSTPGDVAIIATKFLPAGTTITQDHVAEGRVSSEVSLDGHGLATVIGRTVSVDVGAGEILTERVFESRTSDRIELAIPLGVNPPESWTRGKSVSLWAIDSNGILPPQSIARNATVVAFADSGFGAETMATLLVDSFEVDRILAIMGSSRIIVATSTESS